MEKQERLKFLTQLTNGLICIEDVAILLSSSLSNCRKYRYLGIIEPIGFDKQRHLYDLGEVRDVKENFVKLKMSHNLSQLASLFKKRREKRQENYPEGYPWPVISKEEKITGHRRRENQLVYRATRYSLTGLAYRMLIGDHLEIALAQEQRNGHKFSIMLLDLDNFKDIKSRLVYPFENKLRQVVGDRLKSFLRKADTVAQMRGNEFLLFLPNTPNKKSTTIITQKILEAFQKPFSLNNRNIDAKISIGIAMYPGDGKDVETLIRRADIAMNYAKEKDHSNYQYYKPALDNQVLK
jgi:diguanylate cyclase (GGDEF)-like protein